MEIATLDQVFHFGGYTLDLGKGTLRHADGPAFLRPKAYAVLTLLARHMGRVVPKSEIMDAVWPGVFVTEDSLTQSVREIRKVLGDDLVRTVSKRGYMLAAEVEPAPEIGSQPIVAVLRFRNESGNPADDPIVDGFAEDIINGLARFGTVTVLARNSSFSFASYARSEWPQIRSRIGADYLVEGSVRRQGDQILAAVNLVDAANASQLWGDRYQAADSGFSAIQQDIVEEIVGRLARRVTNAGLQQASRKPVTSLAAYELVLRGVALVRDPAQTDIEGARAFFEAAVAKDPAYGLAHIYVGLTCALKGEFEESSHADLVQAREHVARGLALSPDQATGHRIQSLVRLYMREHDAAEHHLQDRARAQSLRCRLHRADGPCADHARTPVRGAGLAGALHPHRSDDPALVSVRPLAGALHDGRLQAGGRGAGACDTADAVDQDAASRLLRPARRDGRSAPAGRPHQRGRPRFLADRLCDQGHAVREPGRRGTSGRRHPAGAWRAGCAQAGSIDDHDDIAPLIGPVVGAAATPDGKPIDLGADAAGG